MQQQQIQVNKIELSEPQYQVMEARSPIILNMAGQGSGKSALIGMLTGVFVVDYPQVLGFIAANTDMQVTQSTLSRVFDVWKKYFGFEEYTKENPNGDFVIDKHPPRGFKKFINLKRYHNTISFRNGALIFTGSLENYKAHDGKEFGYAHLDETKDTKESALSSVILARLRQRGLWTTKDKDIVFDDTISQEEAKELGYTAWNPCWIHTSPAENGVDWLIEMFKIKDQEKDIYETLMDTSKFWHSIHGIYEAIIHQTHWNAHNLPPGHIEKELARFSEGEAEKFLYGFPFAKSGGEYYSGYSRKNHVKEVEIDTDAVMHLTYDFNVMPYLSQLLFQVKYVDRWHDLEDNKKYPFPFPGAKKIRVMVIRYVKEYPMRDPLNTTQAATQAFLNDFEKYKPIVFVYGDASGRNRITGLGSETQYKIIERGLSNYLPNGWLRVPKKNIGPAHRRNIINRILQGKVPAVEIEINPECKQLIRDLQFIKTAADGGKNAETEKDATSGISYEKFGHMSDAFDYSIMELCAHLLKKIN